MGASMLFLTVSEVQGHNEPCPFANGTGRGRLGNTSASSATQRRFFMPAAIVSMAAGIGTPSGVPVPWFRSSTPDVSRHPIVVEGDRDGFQTNQESEMSVTTPKGNAPEIRPNTSSDSITWVKEQTVIKRIRRALATKGHYLQKSRIGTDAFKELGQYAVLDDHFIPLTTDCKLPELAKFLGVLADDELIDPPLGRGWVHQVVRLSQVDGVIYSTPVSRTYTTKEAAERAAAKFAGDDVGIHSWDVEVKGGKQNADH